MVEKYYKHKNNLKELVTLLLTTSDSNHLYLLRYLTLVLLGFKLLSVIRNISYKNCIFSLIIVNIYF